MIRNIGFLLSLALLQCHALFTNAAEVDMSIDDSLFISSFNTTTGVKAEDNKAFSIEMTNKDSIWGLQFDLRLPDGMKLAEGESPFQLNALRFPQKNSGGAMTFKHTIMYNTLQDGWTRVLVFSMDPNLFIKGNVGEVMKVAYTTDSTMTTDICAVCLRNVYLVINGAKDCKPKDAETQVAVYSYILGDANSDGSITVSDFTAIANHILGTTSANFNAEAADVNEDGSITVSDLTGVANLILYGSPKGKQQIE